MFGIVINSIQVNSNDKRPNQGKLILSPTSPIGDVGGITIKLCLYSAFALQSLFYFNSVLTIK